MIRLSLFFILILFFSGCPYNGNSKGELKITATTPLNNDVNIQTTDNLTIRFNNKMNESTINSTNFILTKLSNNTNSSITVSYNALSNIVMITPGFSMDDNTFYKLTIKSSVSDIYNDTLDSDKVINFMVGNTLTHLGYLYKVIKSPISSKNWIDRNIGAYTVCTKSRDDISFANDSSYVTSQEDCFGDLYQWGRLSDGHQEVVTDILNSPNKTLSNTTNVRSLSYSNIGFSDFITNSTNSYDWVQNTIQDANDVDDDGSLRKIQWASVDGTGVCPEFFKIPTSSELYEETSQYNGIDNISTGAVKVINRDTAFKNFLKFPSTGHRYFFTGALQSRGSSGIVWTNDVHQTTANYSTYLGFSSTNSSELSFLRTYGFSLRCMKE